MATVEVNDITLDGTSIEVRYKAVNGSRFNTTDATRIGPELLRLKKEHGSLTKALIVESARSEESPLHGDYEWDDAEAAKAHRLTQAGYMMRSILIAWDEEQLDGSTEEVSTRLLETVIAPVAEDEISRGNRQERIVVSFKDVVETPDYARQIIETAETSLKKFDAKFRFYLERLPAFAARFQAVFDEIKALEDDISV